jgi:hypothetical protein
MLILLGLVAIIAVACIFFFASDSPTVPEETLVPSPLLELPK